MSSSTGRQEWPTPPPAPKRKPWYKRGWFWFVLLAAVFALIISAGSRPSETYGAPKSGGVNGIPTPTQVGIPAAVAAAERSAAARASALAGAQVGQHTPPPAPSAAPPPARGIGDGTFEVGADIPPGKYKTSGPDPDQLYVNCYYARLKHNDGSFGDIIQNNNTKGPATVTIKAGEYFQSQGCAEWVKQ